jgi:hypothetical protein
VAELVVSHSASIPGRGVAIFFVEDPDPWLPWKPHRVRVTKPDGVSFEAVARVEFARKVPPGEVMTLLFTQMKTAEDVPVGSHISVVGLATANDV